VAALRHGEADSLARRPRELALAQLGPQSRVGTQRRGGLGQDAEELRDGPTARLNALDQGSASVGSGELVMDVEAAYVGLDRHLVLV
jgi:hypothetical protein